jgi:hypothetical protein
VYRNLQLSIVVDTALGLHFYIPKLHVLTYKDSDSTITQRDQNYHQNTAEPKNTSPNIRHPPPINSKLTTNYRNWPHPIRVNISGKSRLSMVTNKKLPILFSPFQQLVLPAIYKISRYSETIKTNCISTWSGCCQ